MVYADLHPGNFLALGDGRIGVLDFGFVLPNEGEVWERYSMSSILYLLKAKIDVGAIAEAEVKATGWDRSDYT